MSVPRRMSVGECVCVRAKTDSDENGAKETQTERRPALNTSQLLRAFSCGETWDSFGISRTLHQRPENSSHDAFGIKQLENDGGV